MMQENTKIDGRLRTMRILWFAMLSNVLIFFFFVKSGLIEVTAQPNNTLSIALVVIGALLVVVSFPIKQRFLKLAEQQQKPEVVQSGFVMAWAICEGAALLAIMDRVLTGGQFYLILFVLAATGMALNAPRREHLLAATYKSSTDKLAS